MLLTGYLTNGSLSLFETSGRLWQFPVGANRENLVDHFLVAQDRILQYTAP